MNLYEEVGSYKEELRLKSLGLIENRSSKIK